MTSMRLGTKVGLPVGRGMLGVGPSFAVHFLDAGPGMDVPSQVYDTGLQAIFVQQLNDRWMTQLMLGPVMRSDFAADEETIDVVGMAMARWQARPKLGVMFGAVATGVEEFPVAPLFGLQYAPTDSLMFDFMIPQPQISARLYENYRIDFWGYVSGKFGGGRCKYRVHRVCAMNCGTEISS